MVVKAYYCRQCYGWRRKWRHVIVLRRIARAALGVEGEQEKGGA